MVRWSVQAATTLASATLTYAMVVTSPSLALEPIRIEADVDQSQQYFKTINDLSLDASEDTKPRKALSRYLKGPQGKEIEKCARKCTSTCIRGGQGAPGLGPMAVRRESVVFKDSYRSSKYCLGECVEVCALEIAQQQQSKAANK